MKDNRKLRYGYTTGSCAAAAAQRAAALALGADFAPDDKIILDTPKGIRLELTPEKQEAGDGWASCAVKKDSGDDPDATNGVLVYAKVMRTAQQPDRKGPKPDCTSAKEDGIRPEIELVGGLGIGKVTKPGLACAVGEAAINPVPRKMILEQVEAVCEEFDYAGGLRVEISIPEGVEIARKTFNPRLGIEGGISILGTSGIVEPMSEQALIDTIKTEMNVRKAEGADYLVITPGNYGETFLKTYMNGKNLPSVKCSNFIGEALDFAEQMEFKGVLLVGHIGKLVKTAAGIMNTHSKYGDARMEILGIHAAMAGASSEVVRKLFGCITTEEAIAVLDEAAVREQTLASLLQKLDEHIRERVHHHMEIGAILFSNFYGYLGETRDAGRIKEILSGQKEL
jgi:cobalt-precorrin-5B (C1)-methyltransferase